MTTEISEYGVKKDMSLGDLRNSLTDLEGIRTETYYFAQSGLEQRDDGVVEFRGNRLHRYRMSDAVYFRIGKHLGIPHAYISKTPPSLMLSHINYWFSQFPQRTMTLGLSEDDVITYVYKGSNPPISSLLALDIVEDRLGPDVQFHHSTVSPDYIRFSAVTAEQEREVKKDDVFRFGVSFTNSQSLKVPTQVSAYTHRLVCTNGMVSESDFARHRGAADNDQRAWLEKAIDDAISAADNEFKRLESMNAVSFDDHLSTYLLRSYDTFGVPKPMRDVITQSVINARPQTLYDLFNVITDMASNSAEALQDPMLSSRLMAAASRMSIHQDICKQCGKPN